MPNPKCTQCSKIIPDGFTDCPWCGAIQPPRIEVALPSGAPAGHSAVPGSYVPAGVALFLSLAFVFGSGLFSIARDKAANPLANPAYFRGEWFGIFFWAAIIVTTFGLIRERRLGSTVKFMAVFAPGVLVCLLILSKPTPHLRPDPAALGPMRPFFLELLSRNNQYVSDVSKLDDALQPLYSPASFRDADSIQAILGALDQRLAIADKYADMKPILAKLPGYISATEVTDKDKREFIAGFNESFERGLKAKNSLSALERNWILSAVDLYKFALVHRSSYSYSPGNISYKNPRESATFGNKLNQSRELYAEFLRAYQASRRAQDAALAQMGLSRSDLDSASPR